MGAIPTGLGEQDMKLRLFICAAALLGLSACRGTDHTVAPAMVHLSGMVRFESGQPVQRAIVSVAGEDTAYGQVTGEYHLTVPYSSDSISVRAIDAYPYEVIAGRYYNVVKVRPDHDQVLNIALTEFQPI